MQRDDPELLRRWERVTCRPRDTDRVGRDCIAGDIEIGVGLPLGDRHRIRSRNDAAPGMPQEDRE